MYGGTGSGEPSLSSVSNSGRVDRAGEAPVDVVVDQRPDSASTSSSGTPARPSAKAGQHQQLNASRQTLRDVSGSASP